MPVIRTNSELEQKLLGKPGVPSDQPSLYDPIRDAPPEVDLLGRVNGRTYPEQDNVPDYLMRSAVQKALAPKRKVTILKDHTLVYPTLCFSVFVQPDPSVPDDEARFAKMFARAGCKRAKSLEEADLVVFAGGSDVDPVLYGAKPHKTTHSSPTRDGADMDLYLFCLERGIPMFGVCRGAQFLHVMNGGKLFQHVDGHYGPHPILDLNRRVRIEKVSSVHHQMVVENLKGGMEVIATAATSNERWLDDHNKKEGTNADIEAFFYRNTGCIGVQGHPEYEGYNFYTKWCLELLVELVFMNPDFEWTEERLLRMKPSLLEERKLLNPKQIPLIVPAGNKEKA